MSLFAKLKVWKIFGRMMNSPPGIRFINTFRGAVELLMKPLAAGKGASPPPFAPLGKNLREARVGLVTTTGIYLAGQEPFDVDAALGDSSYRVIPSDADVSELRIAHTHYPHERAERDINVIFPVERLRELVDEGVIGSAAPSLFSFGFDLHVRPLVDERSGSAHQLARALQDDGVDVVLFTPG